MFSIAKAQSLPYHCNHRSSVDIVDFFFGILFRIGANPAVPANYEIALDRLNQSEWVDLDGSALPLTKVAAVWVTLKIAL